MRKRNKTEIKTRDYKKKFLNNNIKLVLTIHMPTNWQKKIFVKIEKKLLYPNLNIYGYQCDVSHIIQMPYSNYSFCYNCEKFEGLF